jgi:hypothetical protein
MGDRHSGASDFVGEVLGLREFPFDEVSPTLPNRDVPSFDLDLHSSSF